MQNKSLISWLRLTVFLMFLGRAWQHLSWGGPYGSLIQFITGMNEHEYTAKFSDSSFLANLNIVFGIVFLLAAFSVLLVNKRKSYYKITVKIGWYLLFVVAFGYFAEENHTWGQLLEYSAQLITPYLLLIAVKYKMKNKFIFIAKLAIATTFICHGLYAFGYYPVPDAFIDMLIKGFGMNEPQAVYWLRIFGVVDFAFALGIFIPFVSRYFLFYGLIWGFFTAFARIYTQVNLDFLEADLGQYTYEFLVRTPHFIIPLILLKYKKDIII